MRRAQLKVLFITGEAEGAVLGEGGTRSETQLVVTPFAMSALAATIKAMP